MKNVEHSQAFLRKRKMMMVLPLLVIPFLTLAFWAMGGGKANDNTKQFDKSQGLNLQLPNANLKDEKLMDKLSFYDQVEKDSLKLLEQMRNDPYFGFLDSMKEADSENHKELEEITQTSAAKFKQTSISTGLKTSPYSGNWKNDPEEQIMQKLALLEKEMNKSAIVKEPDDKSMNDYMDQNNGEFSSEVDRLESMMEVMNKGNEDDPEMKQLENTLDKILDIQHPERVKDRIKERSLKNKEVVFAVSKEPAEQSISLLDTVKKKIVAETGFYGLDDGVIAEEQNAIEAVVHETQILVNGAIVKFRLLNDIYINGSLILKDNFVYGIASLNDERMEIQIYSIRNNKSLFPVKLVAYDMDGLPGIYIPGAITRDVAKQSADNSLQLMELTAMDPSLKAQAAAAGINTAKNLLSKKVKLVKVVVKGGYKVLLKDKNVQQ